jgi:phosphoglycerol transferase MdoB-like AlkP superfamily enzyme
MTDDTTPIATLFERAEDYTKTSVNLFKLNAVDKSAEIVSSLFSLLVVVLTVVLSIIIISLGAALWIGKLLGDSYYGFFVIGAFYMLVAILLRLFREQWLKYPVSNSIIKQMMKPKTV